MTHPSFIHCQSRHRDWRYSRSNRKELRAGNESHAGEMEAAAVRMQPLPGGNGRAVQRDLTAAWCLGNLGRRIIRIAGQRSRFDFWMNQKKV